jgi:hypothetical protein
MAMAIKPAAGVSTRVARPARAALPRPALLGARGASSSGLLLAAPLRPAPLPLFRPAAPLPHQKRSLIAKAAEAEGAPDPLEA